MGGAGGVNHDYVKEENQSLQTNVVQLANVGGFYISVCSAKTGE
jgi:hypothetical protein